MSRPMSTKLDSPDLVLAAQFLARRKKTANNQSIENKVEARGREPSGHASQACFLVWWPQFWICTHWTSNDPMVLPDGEGEIEQPVMSFKALQLCLRWHINFYYFAWNVIFVQIVSFAIITWNLALNLAIAAFLWWKGKYLEMIELSESILN